MKQQPFMATSQFSTSPVPLASSIGGGSGGGVMGSSPSFGSNGQFGASGQHFGSNGSFGVPSQPAPDPWTPVPPSNNSSQLGPPWMKSGEQPNPFLS